MSRDGMSKDGGYARNTESGCKQFFVVVSVQRFESRTGPYGFVYQTWHCLSVKYRPSSQSVSSLVAYNRKSQHLSFFMVTSKLIDLIA